MSKALSSSKDTSTEWKKYICRACGLIYDEALGDPDSGLIAGTRFEDIPDDWECPLCGVTKLDFEPYEAIICHEVNQASIATCKNADQRIIIIGAGLAGWSVAENIRRLDAHIPILLISACEANAYHKPELSVAFSRQKTLDQLIKENAVDKAKRLNVQLLTECFVVGANKSFKQIRTTKGNFTYNKLILAHGAQSFLPEAFPPQHCFRINNLQHWQGLAKKLNPQSRIAIIGAGMIGCEIAEDLAFAGHHIHLIERNQTPLSNLLPEYAGKKLIEAQQQFKIQFYGNRQVHQVTAKDSHKVLQLDNDTKLRVDIVIIALGLRTDSKLANQLGLSFNQGYVVNPQTLQTSHPDIYALGDCINIAGQACRFIEPIAKQAQTIAHHILEREHAGYQHVSPLIRLKTKSIAIEIQGNPQKDLTWEEIEHTSTHLHMRQLNHQHTIAELKMAYQ